MLAFRSFFLIILLYSKATFSVCDSYCDQCDNDVCKICISHRYLDYAGYCVSCEPQCKECESMGYMCTACEVGSYLSGTKCLKCSDQNCIDCVNDKCIQCKQGYSVYGNDGVCQKCDDTCLTCNGPSQSDCTECTDGFYNPAQGSGSQSFSCTNCATNCKKCHGSDISQCDECSDGYFQLNGQCVSCDPQCATCTESKTHCTSCPDGFYLEGTECLACYENCKKCTSSDEYDCIECMKGYLVSYGWCQSCESATRINGCPSCKRNKNNEAVCSECPPGYLQEEDGDGDDETWNCQACTYRCLSCPQNTWTCERCEDHYYVDSYNGCSECESPCLLCSGSATSCDSCIEGYYHDANSHSCSKCPDNCLYCSSVTNCVVCNNTYYPVDGVCTKCHESCERCHDGTNSCDECKEKYYFNQNNQCEKCSEHCNQCNATYCFVCEENYYSVDGVCTPCAEVCSHCNGPTADDCIQCDPGYFFSESFSACYKCDDSCETCEYNYNQCKTCAYGYYSAQWGGCYKCELNCEECTSFSNCLKCKEGFRLYYRDGEQEPDCQPCKNRGCKDCKDGVNQCSECKVGYYASSKDSNNYVNCAMCPEGCKQCNAEQSGRLKCTECYDGFYLANGICYECSSPCATCSDENTCLSCIQGYLFDGVSKCNSKCSSDCLTCEGTSNTCTSCHNEYVLAGTRCVHCSEGCKRCEMGYQGGNRCTSCIDGYYYQYYNDACSKCDESCATCNDGLPNSCTSCKTGYYFSSASFWANSRYTGECSPCDGVGHENCELCVENCNEDDSTCSEIPICIKCKVGYYINENNLCSKCSDYCAICDVSNPQQCIECEEGYYLYNQKCSKCSPSCLTCDSDPDHCTSCNPGKFLKDGKCESCDTAICTECVNSSSYCTKCQNDKFVYEGKCYSSCNQIEGNVGTNITSKECYNCVLLDSCVKYDDSCQCSSCTEGYYLSGLNCEKCPTGCSSCSSTECNSCFTGYFLNAQQSCEKCADGCETCSGTSTTCQTCTNGYYHDKSKNACNKCDDSCYNCTGPDNNNCITCNDGYMLTEGSCRKAPEGCSGNRCDFGNDSDQTLQNFTIDATIIPSFESATNEGSGGAMHLVNVGLTATDVEFDKCISENGGGGGIYIFNNAPPAETTYSIKLTKLTFKQCKANFGAALYVYSSSENSPVLIESCKFISNEITKSDGEIQGGSAIYITAKLAEINECEFLNNKGKGSIIKVSEDFDVYPEKLKLLHSLNNYSHGSVLISKCSFDIDESSDCSLFYSYARSSTKVEVNNCLFTGKLSKGAHHINGFSVSNEKPNILIKKCIFETDQFGALNDKFVKIDLNSQLKSTKKVFEVHLSYEMLITLSTLAVISIISITAVLKKRNQINQAEFEARESNEL